MNPLFGEKRVDEVRSAKFTVLLEKQEAKRQLAERIAAAKQKDKEWIDESIALIIKNDRQYSVKYFEKDVEPIVRYGDHMKVVDKISRRTTWFKNGHIHRDNGPAMMYPGEARYWYQEGKPHRDNGPAVETRENLVWYQRGVLIKEQAVENQEHSEFKI